MVFDLSSRLYRTVPAWQASADRQVIILQRYARELHERCFEVLRGLVGVRMPSVTDAALLLNDITDRGLSTSLITCYFPLYNHFWDRLILNEAF